MSDEIVRDRLQLILESIGVIEGRFSDIHSPDDFTKDSKGAMILDSIAMRLHAVGENVKKLHKLAPELLEKYPAIDWQSIIRFRDLISHHYEKVDHEIIFGICKEDLPALKTTIHTFLNK